MKYLVPFNLNESFDYKKFEVNSNKHYREALFISDLFINEYRFKDMMEEIREIQDDY